MGGLPAPGTLIGRYRVEALLGHGGTGSVLRVTDVHLQRPAALKLLQGHLAATAEGRARFHREAEVLSRLDSPHIISVLDHGELGDDGGTPYLVTQYVSGGDLDALLQRRGPMPPAMALRVCAQVAEALADAHAAGVVHRDVKAANVLVSETGGGLPFVYLGDFGLAQPTEADATRSQSGTVAAMAPERLLGAPASVASDVYGVGCLLWTCLTGTPPYQGTDAQVTLAHVQSPVPVTGSPDPMGRHLDDVLRRSLAKLPQERHRDARELTGHLLAGADLPAPGFDPRRIAAPVVPQLTTAPPARRGRGVVLAAVAAAVVLLLGAGGAVTWVALAGDDRTDRQGEQGAGPTTPGQDPAPEAGVEGDLDGDGLGDLQVHATGDSLEDVEGQLVRWTSDGSRLVDPVVTPDTDYLSPLAGDFDGDGRADTARLDAINVCPNCALTEDYQDPDPEYEGSVTVTDADGRELQTFLELPRSGSQLTTDLSGDFDGDGLTDLAIAVGGEGEREEDDCRIVVYRSTGTGFSGPEEWASGVRCDSGDPRVGDVDGDGVDDVVLVGAFWEPMQVQLLRSATDGFEEQESVTVPDTSRASVSWSTVGEVDGEPGADLVVGVSRVSPEGDDSDLHLLVFPGGESGLGESTEWAVTDDNPSVTHQVVVSDLDGDGRGDLLDAASVSDALAPGGEEVGDVPVTVWTSDGSSFTAGEGPVCAGCDAGISHDLLDGVAR